MKLIRGVELAEERPVGELRLERIAAAARRMGAALGVTRPVAINAWAPMDRLIGLSGTRTAPALCIVVGASGAPAFHWGIEKAELIVALNPDEHAPIVGHADAAVLDDGVAVIEELSQIIAAKRESDRGDGRAARRARPARRQPARCGR